MFVNNPQGGVIIKHIVERLHMIMAALEKNSKSPDDLNRALEQLTQEFNEICTQVEVQKAIIDHRMGSCLKKLKSVAKTAGKKWGEYCSSHLDYGKSKINDLMRLASLFTEPNVPILPGES